MQKIIKQWWSDLKSFDWKMYLALCLLALVPAIYQTIITKLITVNTNPGALDIIGQMEWFDLINETICLSTISVTINTNIVIKITTAKICANIFIPSFC